MKSARHQSLAEETCWQTFSLASRIQVHPDSSVYTLESGWTWIREASEKVCQQCKTAITHTHQKFQHNTLAQYVLTLKKSLWESLPYGKIGDLQFY